MDEKLRLGKYEHYKEKLEIVLSAETKKLEAIYQ